MNLLEYFFASGIAIIAAILISGCSTCEHMSSDYYEIVLPAAAHSGEWQEDESIQAQRALFENDRILLCQRADSLCISDKLSSPVLAFKRW